MATGSRYARFKRWDRADKSDCVNSDRQKRSIVSALRSQKEKKRKKKKSSLSGFIIARLRYPRYTFYRSKFIGPRYFFMVQVVRAHLCKHYESKSPQLRAENSRRKRWKSHDLSFIFFFFFPLLPSFLWYDRNKSRIFAIWIFARFNSLLSRLLSRFFFYTFGNVWNVLYTVIFDMVGLLGVMLTFNW